MIVASYGTITAEDVEDFRRKMRKQRQTNSPAKAKKRLIESGILTKSGHPTWPTKKIRIVKRRIAVKKAK
jgi:hypothetical protein